MAVEDLAQMARVSQDQNAFKIWRGAFTTTLTADGVSLVNSAHPLIGGGTLSNVIAVGAGGTNALADDTLKNAVVSLRQQKNQAGVIMGNTPSILLVPSLLYELAVQLTESVLMAGTGNNNLNVWSSKYGIKVLTSPYLDLVAGGSDTAWFLLSRNHRVTRLIRQGIQTNLRDWSYSNNRTYFYQANFREEVKVADYVGVVGGVGV